MLTLENHECKRFLLFMQIYFSMRDELFIAMSFSEFGFDSWSQKELHTKRRPRYFGGRHKP